MTEVKIMESEAELPTAGIPVTVPTYLKEVVAEVSQLARRSSHLNQRSGVSVRLSIANYETLVANSVRRALRTGEPVAVPRISDLASLVPSTQGKVEVEAMEEGREQDVVAQLVAAATLAVFRRRVTLDDPATIVAAFTPWCFRVRAPYHVACVVDGFSTARFSSMSFSRNRASYFRGQGSAAKPRRS